MKGWVYEVAEDADYNGGSPHHKDPFYFIEIRLPAARFDTRTQQYLILDFTKIVMLAAEAFSVDYPVFRTAGDLVVQK